MEVGEWLYTSGDDRIFPRGFPAGVVKSVRNAQPYQGDLRGAERLAAGLEDVLILSKACTWNSRTPPPASRSTSASAPPADAAAGRPARPRHPLAGTAADALKSQYKAVGDAQNHTFGVGEPGSKPPDFTKLGQPRAGRRSRAGARRRLGSPAARQRPSAPAVPQPARYRLPPAGARSQGLRGRMRRPAGPGALDELFRRADLLSSEREGRISRFRAWVMVAVPLAAILFQVYVPLFFQFLGFLDLPLLVVVYFALMRRNQVSGLLIGARGGAGAGFALQESPRHVRHRQDAGGLLRRRRSASAWTWTTRSAPGAHVLLLRLPPVFLLGAGARPARPATGLRTAKDADAWRC